MKRKQKNSIPCSIFISSSKELLNKSQNRNSGFRLKPNPSLNSVGQENELQLLVQIPRKHTPIAWVKSEEVQSTQDYSAASFTCCWGQFSFLRRRRVSQSKIERILLLLSALKSIKKCLKALKNLTIFEKKIKRSGVYSSAS